MVAALLATEALNTAEGEDKTKLAAEVTQLRKRQTVASASPIAFRKLYLVFITQALNEEIRRGLDKQEESLAAD